MMRMRTAAVLVLLVLASGLGTACGDDKEPKAPAELLAVDAARAKLRDAGSYAFDLNGRLSLGGPSEHGLLGEARYRLDAQPASAIALTGATGRSGTPAGEVAMTAIGDVRYVRSAALRTPKDRPWVRLSGNEMAPNRYGVAVAWFPPVDPLLWLDRTWSADGVDSMRYTRGGEEKIDGTTTTRYSGDCAGAVARCAGPRLRAWLDRYAPGTVYASVGVWIDGSGQIRRFTVATHLINAEGTFPFQLRATLRDIGSVAPIDQPPPAEVVASAEAFAA